MITGVAEQTNQKDTKLGYKQDLSDSELEQEHNKNSEKGMTMWVGASCGTELLESSLEENILRNRSWIQSGQPGELLDALPFPSMQEPREDPYLLHPAGGATLSAQTTSALCPLDYGGGNVVS